MIGSRRPGTKERIPFAHCRHGVPVRRQLCLAQFGVVGLCDFLAHIRFLRRGFYCFGAGLVRGLGYLHPDEDQQCGHPCYYRLRTPAAHCCLLGRNRPGFSVLMCAQIDNFYPARHVRRVWLSVFPIDPP
jgi:hypothetical protein